MSAKAFFDSSVFICAYDPRDRTKQDSAVEPIREYSLEGNLAISYQVIQEFLNFALLKAGVKVSSDDAQVLLQDVFRPLRIIPQSIALISDAIRIQNRYRLSWYGSLIVSAAQQAGCSRLYSEDLQHGQQFGTVTIQDPFR